MRSGEWKLLRECMFVRNPSRNLQAIIPRVLKLILRPRRLYNYAHLQVETVPGVGRNIG